MFAIAMLPRVSLWPKGIYREAIEQNTDLMKEQI